MINIEEINKYPLVCKELRKNYDVHIAVKNFSLCIRQGEIFGLLGPNGAGKTTILSMLTGMS